MRVLVVKRHPTTFYEVLLIFTQVIFVNANATVYNPSYFH